MTHSCPDQPHPGIVPDEDVVGCGHTFEAEPDEYGWVECPVCGILFDTRAA